MCGVGVCGYEANLGAWFGRHRLATSYERAEEVLLAGRDFENYTVNGRLFNSDPNNANNRVAFRTYVDPLKPSTVAFGSRTFSPYSWTDAAGNSYQTYWARNTVNATDSMTKNRARMLADQVYFFRDKLVITGGYREEEVSFLNRAAYVRSADGLNYVRPPDASFATIQQTLRTKTLGGVCHVTRGVSLFANVSNNNGQASQHRRLAAVARLVKNRIRGNVAGVEASRTWEKGCVCACAFSSQPSSVDRTDSKVLRCTSL